jgi:adenylate cyclase
MQSRNSIGVDTGILSKAQQIEQAIEWNNRARDLKNQLSFDEAILASTTAFDFALESGDVVQQGRALATRGSILLELGNYASSLSFLVQALELFESVGDLGRIAITYGNIGRVHRNMSNYDTALDYYLRALTIDEELGNYQGIANHIGNIGNIYLTISDYPKALHYYHQALAFAEKIDNSESIATNIGNIGSVYLHIQDYTSALEYYMKALTIQEKLGDLIGSVINTCNIAAVHFHLKEYQASLDYFLKALDIYRTLDNKTGVAETYSNIGVIYKEISDYENSLNYYHKSLTLNQEMGNKFGIALNVSGLGVVYSEELYKNYNPDKAEELLLQALQLYEELGVRKELYDIHQILSALYHQTGNWQKAYHYHKLYHDLEKEVLSEEAKKHAEQLYYERKTAERDKQIAIDHAKHEATEHLLHNVLPPSIAAKMLDGATLIAEKLQNVSVLFADIVEFTKLSQLISAEDLVAGLDGIFSEFDALAEKHGLEKIKTIGDSYMVVSGAPTPRADHAESIALMAFDMMQAMQKFTSITTGERIRIRIGIHTGDVVAGVIGKKKFAYDLWGDAVNTASRMESHGEPGKVHITQEFKNVLVEQIAAGNHHLHLRFEEREPLHIKGKGMMSTYFLYPSDTGR